MMQAKPKTHGIFGPAGQSKASTVGAVPKAVLDPTLCPRTTASPTPSLPTLLSIDATAVELSVSTKTVRRLITSGALPFCRVGRLVRIRAVDLETFVASGTEG